MRQKFRAFRHRSRLDERSRVTYPWRMAQSDPSAKAPGIPATRLDHTAICVEDMDASIALLEELFGQKVAHREQVASQKVSAAFFVRFAQLQQGSPEGPRMEKSNLVAPRAGTADLVEEGDAPRVEALEQAVEIFHAQRQVVERVAALFEELLQAGVSLRRDQLQ